MTHPLDRRQFITGLAATGAAGLLAPALCRGAADDITIGLSQYSLRQLFGKTLSVLDYPAFAREKFGIAQIDVWEGGLPRKNDPAFYKEMNRRVDHAGSNVFLWMTGVVDAKHQTAAERKKEHEKFHAAVDNAAKLDATYVRVFLRAPDVEPAEAAQRCAETLGPLADYAQKQGRTLAIEPGASRLSAQGDFLAAVMKQMNHDHCRLMPDFGKFRGDIYAGTAAMMPHTAVVSAKSHDFDAEGNEKRFDYHRLMKIITGAGFKGIVAIEYEGKHLPPVEGVLATRDLLRRALGR